MTTTAQATKCFALLVLCSALAHSDVQPSFQFGTSQAVFNNYPAQLSEMSQGTVAIPVTANGPTVKISRTENMPSGACGGNYVANECNAALYAVSVDNTTGYMQVSGIFGGAVSNSSQIASHHDAVGVTGLGANENTGTGRGTGGYLQGSNYSSASGAAIVGAEIRADNETTGNCTLTYGLGVEGQCDGLWITAQSKNGAPTTLSSAVHVGSVSGSNGWAEGLTINVGGAVNYGVNDQSSSTTAINVGTGHTTAFSSPGFSVAGANGLVTLPNFTVATLPACNGTTTQYATAVVTDATAYTANGTLTGGGSVKTPVFCNGTAWTMH